MLLDDKYYYNNNDYQFVLQSYHVLFYNGNILVINGLGNSSAPNKLKAYDINCAVVGEYVFYDYQGTEPEGIFYDRKSGAILVSYLNGDIIEITL